MVVATKMVSWLRFLLSWSPLFAGDLHKIFVAMPWMWGYQALCLQDGGCNTEREHAKQTIICSKQDFISVALLVIVEWKLKVARNLLQTFNLDVWYGSAEEWLYACNWKSIHCPSLNDRPQSPLSQQVNFAVLPAHSDVWTQIILLC